MELSLRVSVFFAVICFAATASNRCESHISFCENTFGKSKTTARSCKADEYALCILGSISSCSPSKDQKASGPLKDALNSLKSQYGCHDGSDTEMAKSLDKALKHYECKVAVAGCVTSGDFHAMGDACPTNFVECAFTVGYKGQACYDYDRFPEIMYAMCLSEAAGCKQSGRAALVKACMDGRRKLLENMVAS